MGLSGKPWTTAPHTSTQINQHKASFRSRHLGEGGRGDAGITADYWEGTQMKLNKVTIWGRGEGGCGDYR